MLLRSASRFKALFTTDLRLYLLKYLLKALLTLLITRSLYKKKVLAIVLVVPLMDVLGRRKVLLSILPILVSSLVALSLALDPRVTAGMLTVRDRERGGGGREGGRGGERERKRERESERQKAREREREKLRCSLN